jgi:hypothetical protein
MTFTLLLQFAATWTMIGIIWFVQIVHYPLFARVDGPAYRQFMADHTRLTGWVVGPPMLAEAAASLLLVFQAESPVQSLAAWAGLVLVGLIWASTWLLQVPRHRQLASGFDARSHAALVSTNWIRVVAWSLRGVLAAWWLTGFGAS